MLRMFRELKGSYRYIVLIFALLFGQAFCDLALPSYTSDIINVGVQQGGIPDSVPDQIRESSMNQLFLFMDSDQQQEVKEYYTLKDGLYTHKKLKEEEKEIKEEEAKNSAQEEATTETKITAEGKKVTVEGKVTIEAKSNEEEQTTESK